MNKQQLLNAIADDFAFEVGQKIQRSKPKTKNSEYRDCENIAKANLKRKLKKEKRLERS
jgi:hypothetical protein